MLLNGHYLNGVIAVGMDTGQHFVAELGVGAHALALLGHTYVTFVNEQRLGVGLKVGHLPRIRLGSPDLCGKQMRHRILDHTCGVGRQTFAGATGPAHIHFIEIAVMQGIGRQRDFPHTVVAHTVELIAGHSLPTRKITYHTYRSSAGSPLAEGPGAVGITV